jgi:quinoprotein dehydrogenase-associated probable ABC transporter substrate-binding protein
MSRFGASLVAMAALLVLLAATDALGETTGAEKLKAAKTDFRVCAVINNLPFTNERGEGFDNKIAELLAKAEGKTLTYAWWSAPRGFVSHTLGRFDCDVVMGVPANYELTATTRPYYCSSYMAVTKAGVRMPVLDSSLAAKRIGVMVRTPPLDLLLRHHVEPLVYLPNSLDETSEAHRIVGDVAAGQTDAALAWGPIAGYFAARESTPLALRPIADTDPDLRFTFPISMGVRHQDHERLNRLNALIEQHQSEINAILKAYGVPLIENSAQCQPRQHEAALTPTAFVQPVADQQGGASTGTQPEAPAQQQPKPGNGAQSGASEITCNGPVKQDDIPKIGGGQSEKETTPPFTVKGNNVDKNTYLGWIRFAGFCERCHGTGGVGSALAPDLTKAMATLTRTQFDTIVSCGLIGNRGIGAMPAWGEDPNIAPYLAPLWSYLQARAKGGLGPGRPEELQQTANEQSGQQEKQPSSSQ